MTKVKDGFWKALGSKIGDNDYLLKAGGGYVGVGSFSLSGHTHDGRYVLKSGDSMSGSLSVLKRYNFTNDPSGYDYGGLYRNDQITPSGDATTMWLFSYNDINIYGKHVNIVGSGGAPTINSNIIWHAGNDGSGSGLDADYLDGYHFSDLESRYVNVTGDTMTGKLSMNISGYGWLTGVDNYHGLVLRGVTSGYGGNLSITASDTMEFVEYGGVFNFKKVNTSENTTIATINSSGMSILGNTVWHAGNDGSGSGLDADYLDGQHGSYYHIQTARSYSSVDALPSGDEGWYNIVTLNDNPIGSIICTIQAYAHTSITFIVSKGYSTTATCQILQYNTSANGYYFYVKGVRVVDGGKVQALFNKPAGGTSDYIYVNINIFSTTGTVRPNSTLTLETGDPTVIAGPCMGVHNKITSDINGSSTYSTTSGSSNYVSWSNVGSGTNSNTLYLDFPSFVLRDANANWILGKDNNTTGILSLGSANIAQDVELDSSGGNLTLKGDGKVGIGTKSPSQKLEVNGDIKFKNSLFANNGKEIFCTGDYLAINSDITTRTATFNLQDVYLGYNSGKVGIGTTSPGYKLDVNGDVKTAHHYMGGYLYMSFGGSWLSTIDNDGSGPIFGHALALNNRRTYFVGSPVYICGGSYNNYASGITVTSNNKVGIGTTNPISKLDVRGHITVGTPGSQNYGRIGNSYSSDDTNKYNYIDFYSDGASSGGDIIYTAGIWTSGDHVAHRFDVNQYDKALVIRNITGYVGIGTDSPSYRLDVNSSSRVKTNLIIWGDEVYSNGKGLYIRASDNTNRALITWNGNVASTDYLNLYTVYGNINLNPAYYVGIGTYSPSYKLHVEGSIYSSSGFVKGSSSDSYFLLGGGGHTATSNYSLSTHNHDSRYVRLYGLIDKNFNIPDGGSYSGVYYVHGSASQSNAPATYGLIADFNDGAGHLQLWGSGSNDLRARSYWWTGDSGFAGYTNWVSLIHSGNIGSQSVNYATSAGSATNASNATYATSAGSATNATNLMPENTAHYFRDPTNGAWRGGMFWGSAGSESMSFVVVNGGTRFQFVGGSDIANWTSNTWQNVTPYLTISSSGISTSGTSSATGFVKSSSSDSYVLLGGGGHKAESSLSVSYASSSWNSSLLGGYSASDFQFKTSRSYTSVDATPSGSEGWYDIFNISDYTDGVAICTIRAYAHSSITFMVSKGWSTSATCQVLQYCGSSNGSYFYVKGVRVVDGGRVQALFNKGYVQACINIFSTTGTLTPNSTLMLETGSPTVIAGPCMGVHGWITSNLSGTASNADTLDGYHWDSFSLSGHTHDGRYVLKSGDSMSGSISVLKRYNFTNDPSGYDYGGLYRNDQITSGGDATTMWLYSYNDINIYGKHVNLNGANAPTVNGYTIIHAGNWSSYISTSSADDTIWRDGTAGVNYKIRVGATGSDSNTIYILT